MMFLKNRLVLALLAFFVLMTGGILILGREPNFQMSLERRYGSPMPLALLKDKLKNLDEWPDFVHFVKSAQFAKLSDSKSPRVVRLLMKPRKTSAKLYELGLQIEGQTETDQSLEYSYALFSDESGRLGKMFSDIHWELGVLVTDHATQEVRTFVSAKTNSFRARVYGRLAPKILMNQIQFFDFEQLAGIKPAPSLPLVPD